VTKDGAEQNALTRYARRRLWFEVVDPGSIPGISTNGALFSFTSFGRRRRYRLSVYEQTVAKLAEKVRYFDGMRKIFGRLIFKAFGLFLPAFGFELRKRPAHWLGTLDSLIGKVLDGTADLILDVGANRGQTVHRVRRMFGDAVEIHCFEPSSSAFEALEKNVVGTNLVLNRLAVSDSDGVATIQVPEGRDDLSSLLAINLGSSWSRDRGTSLERMAMEQIQTTTLDSYCEEFTKRIDLLKIDTQGLEPLILSGAQRLLRDERCRPKVIQLEVNLGNSYGKSTNISEIDAPLSLAGYKMIYWSSAMNLWDLPSAQVDVLYVDREILSHMPG